MSGDADLARQRMAESGAGLLGIAGGAALGAAFIDPAGAVVGATAGALLQDTLKWVAGDMAVRFTSQTEQERMGAVYLLAQNQIVERLNGGQQPRAESFFRPRERRKAKKLRSEAEELLEGTFLAARSAYEERKVQLLANFYSNVVFRDDLDPSHANYVLSLMESLTYRQLLSVIIIGIKQSGDPVLSMVRSSDFRGGAGLDMSQVGVLYEIFQLAKLDLVVGADSGYILGVADINPSGLKLQGTGVELYNLMTPVTLDSEDYAYFINAFKPGFLTQQGRTPGQ